MALWVMALLLGVTLQTTSAIAAASGWIGDTHAAARLITAVEATGSGSRLDGALQIRLAPGWHVYWRTPGEAGFAPSIGWNGSKNLAAAEVVWPAPKRLVISGLQNAVYVGQVVLPITLTLEHPGAPARLHAVVDYAACAEVCVPYHAEIGLTLPAGLAVPGAEAPLIAAARARVPAGLAESDLRLVGAVVRDARRGGVELSVRLASLGAPLRAPDLFVEGLPSVFPAHPDVILTDAGDEATLRSFIPGTSAAKLAGTRLHLTVVDGARAAEAEVTPILGELPPQGGQSTRFAIVGLALLGGLILNLMPCVLPVLSLKLLALVGYGRGERRRARLGLLATAAGIVGSFGVLAVVLIALKAAGSAIGWGIQFQQPWFLAGMALLTATFAASLWGWVPIALPGGMAGAVGSIRGRRPLTDAFIMGAFATLLAASCSAPFVGTALGFAFARGPLDIALVFASLGLGMAAPLLAVAVWPGLVAWLPRPGPWMEWLRFVLGLALLGTVAWLIAVLATEAGLWSALLAAGLLLVFLVMLAWRHLQSPGQRRARRSAGVAAAVGLAAVLLPTLQGRALTGTTPRSSATAGLWRSYDAAAVQRLAAGGKVVLVDVSASWCLTCKVNELAVLDRSPIAERLRASGVVAMRADWTRPDPAVTAYLKSFGRYGVPLDVVYGPGAPTGIALPELLTPQAVIKAVHRAETVPTRQEAEKVSRPGAW